MSKVGLFGLRGSREVSSFFVPSGESNITVDPESSLPEPSLLLKLKQEKLTLRGRYINAASPHFLVKTKSVNSIFTNIFCYGLFIYHSVYGFYDYRLLKHLYGRYACKFLDDHSIKKIHASRKLWLVTTIHISIILYTCRIHIL